MSPAHDELKHDAAAYALGALEPAERAAFETHLASCAECTAEVRQLRLAAGALPHAVPQVSPPPSLRARILEPGVRPPEPRRAGTPSRRHRSCASGAVCPRGCRSRPCSSSAPASSPTRSGCRRACRTSRRSCSRPRRRWRLADRLTAEARNVAFRAQSAMGVFAAPDVARIDLAGQPVARDGAGPCAVEPRSAAWCSR